VLKKSKKKKKQKYFLKSSKNVEKPPADLEKFVRRKGKFLRIFYDFYAPWRTKASC
jgi:hypothetical protein